MCISVSVRLSILDAFLERRRGFCCSIFFLGPPKLSWRKVASSVKCWFWEFSFASVYISWLIPAANGSSSDDISSFWLCSNWVRLISSWSPWLIRASSWVPINFLKSNSWVISLELSWLDGLMTTNSSVSLWLELLRFSIFLVTWIYFGNFWCDDKVFENEFFDVFLESTDDKNQALASETYDLTDSMPSSTWACAIEFLHRHTD